MFEEFLEMYKAKLVEKEKDLRGYQSMIQLVTTIEKMSQASLFSQEDADSLKRLEEKINRQSRDLRALKMELESAKRTSPPIEKHRRKALDGHAWNLIDLVSKKQGSYTADEIMDMLDLSKTTVISVMKRAVALDPDRLKLTRGERRKLSLAYVP
jgi:hypothetical protein